MSFDKADYKQLDDILTEVSKEESMVDAARTAECTLAPATACSLGCVGDQALDTDTSVQRHVLRRFGDF